MGLLFIGLPEPIEHNPFNCVRFSSVSELNPTQSNGLSSIRFDLIYSIKFDWFGNRTHIKFGVRFDSIAEFNRAQSMDWVRLSSIYYTGILTLHNIGLNVPWSNIARRVTVITTSFINEKSVIFMTDLGLNMIIRIKIGLLTGSPLSHSRERRRAERSGGKESALAATPGALVLQFSPVLQREPALRLNQDGKKFNRNYSPANPISCLIFEHPRTRSAWHHRIAKTSRIMIGPFDVCCRVPTAYGGFTGHEQLRTDFVTNILHTLSVKYRAIKLNLSRDKFLIIAW